ncbi:MAG: rod shape-determining protein MreC [Gemmatimonadota bacterium]
MRYTTIGRPGGQPRDLVVAIAFAVCAFILAGLGPGPTLTVTRVLRSTVLRPFLATHDVFRARTGLVSRVEELGRERDSLAVRAQTSGDLELENRRLRAMLELPPRGFGTYFVAELLPGRPHGGESSRFILRTRSVEDFTTPLAIATPAGLLGVVRSTDGSTGTGDYWTHPDFRAAVVIVDGTATGIVRPFVTSDGEQMMLMEGVPFQTAVPVGAAVVTSGVGGVYPRGLPVGRVLAEHEEQLGWTHSFLVEPRVRPGQESVVLGWLPGTAADSSPPAEPVP